MILLDPGRASICVIEAKIVKLNSEKHVSTLKKALLSACVIVVPGGLLLGLGYMIAKRHKEKVATGGEKVEKAESPRLP